MENLNNDITGAENEPEVIDTPEVTDIEPGAENGTDPEAGSEKSGEITDPEGGTDPDPEGDPEEYEFLYDGKPVTFEPEEETPKERELRERLQKLEQEKQQLQTQPRPQPLTAEPQRPNRDDFYGDDAAYDAALEQYFDNRRQWHEQKMQQQQREEAYEAQGKEALKHYFDTRETAVKQLQNFDRAEKYADDNLRGDVMRAIVFGAKDGTFSNPHNMLYAIGRNPELLERLNNCQDPIVAGALLLEISQKSQTAPKPKAKSVNAIPAVEGVAADNALEEARRKARDTGDYNEVIKLRSAKK